MSQRTFGIEIECGHAEGWLHVGELLRRGPHPQWARGIGMDGSGVEIRSPVLRGREGFKQVHDVMNLLVSEGCFVTLRDGMHVHHGAADFRADKEAIVRLVKSWAANQDKIDSFVAPYRRAAARNARPYNCGWSRDMIARIEAQVARNQFPENGIRPTLNINNIPQTPSRSTIEVRQYGGCLDPEAAEAWIRFCQKFIDSVAGRKRVLATCSSTEVLLRRVKTPKTASTKLLTSRPTNPASYVYAQHAPRGGGW